MSIKLNIQGIFNENRLNLDRNILLLNVTKCKFCTKQTSNNIYKFIPIKRKTIKNFVCFSVLFMLIKNVCVFNY